MTYNGCEASGIFSGWNKLPPELIERARRMDPTLREEARAEVRVRCRLDRGMGLSGGRFHDDEDVLARALSGVLRASLPDRWWTRPHPFHLDASSLTDATLHDYILAAYLDAAAADYWYACEKDYGRDEPDAEPNDEPNDDDDDDEPDDDED